MKKLIKVKVFPNSRKQEIIIKSDNEFIVKVRAKPKQGQANKELITVLASYLKIPKSEMKLIKGAKQRNKIIEIANYPVQNTA